MSLLIKGVTKLSELEIDAAKDWQAQAITNLEAVAAGMTQGGVPFRGAAVMEALAPTTNPNRFLKSQGPDADVAWDEPAVLLSPQRKRFDLLPEDAILPGDGVSNPAGRAQVDGTNLSYFVLDFDQGNEECAFWEWTLPEEFDPDRDILVDIWWISTLNAGDVRFSATIQGKTVDEAWDAALGTTYNVTRAPAGTAGDLMRSVLRIAPTEWDALDAVILKLTRPVLAGHAADARVIAVAVQYGTVGQSKQTFFPLVAPVEVTATGMPNPGDYNVWKTLNLRTLAGIPEVATGIIFHFENYGASDSNYFGIRKTGSTDTFPPEVEIGDRETHCWGMIGISTAGNVDVLIRYQNYSRLWIVGYTISGVTFFTNRVDKSPVGLDAWETIDCSAEAPGACGLIFEVMTADAAATMGARKTGSADARIQGIGRHAWFIIGCDGAQNVDLYKDSANCFHYLVGYITDGAHFHTNGVDKSLAAIDTWADILTVAGAKFAFIEVVGGPNYGLIKKGASEVDAIYLESEGHYWAIVEPDSDGFLRGKIANVAIDFFLVGWATPQE